MCGLVVKSGGLVLVKVGAWNIVLLGDECWKCKRVRLIQVKRGIGGSLLTMIGD